MTPDQWDMVWAALTACLVSVSLTLSVAITKVSRDAAAQQVLVFSRLLSTIQDVPGLMLSVWEWTGDPRKGEQLSDKLVCVWASEGWRRISYCREIIGTTHSQHMPPRDPATDEETGWSVFDEGLTRILRNPRETFTQTGEYIDPERPAVRLPVYSVVAMKSGYVVIWTVDQRHGAAWERLTAWKKAAERSDATLE